MKKYFFSGVLAIAISAVFSGCSKSTDLYDEAAVQKQQQEQKIAELKKAYNDAFIKQFGSIAPGHKWGFDLANASSTRGDVFKVSWEGILMPEEIKNNIGKDMDKPFNNCTAVVSRNDLPDFIKSGNYIVQHVFKQTNKANGADQHHTMAQVQAYDFTTNGGWRNVENFGSECGGNNGKNVFSIKDDAGHQFIKGCTVMGAMGDPTTKPAQPIFKWVDKDDVECTNYVIKHLTGSSDSKKNGYFLGFSYCDKPENPSTDPEQPYNRYDAWIIKLVPAVSMDPFASRGRVFCEDLGAGGDIDFNDVVFDAEVKKDGKVDITIRAAGGTLPIYVAGVKVTLGRMTNTGENEVNNLQTIHLTKEQAQEMGISTVIDIPVTVEYDGIQVPIENIDGSAPGKICTYIGVPWADEYVNIEKAYPDFRQYVNFSAPADWYFNMNEIYTDLILSNNN